MVVSVSIEGSPRFVSFRMLIGSRRTAEDIDVLSVLCDGFDRGNAT